MIWDISLHMLNSYFFRRLCITCIFVVESLKSCLTCDPMDYSPPVSTIHGIFPGKNAGACFHFLLQGILLTQDRTRVSCIGSRILHCWAMREAPCNLYIHMYFSIHLILIFMYLKHKYIPIGSFADALFWFIRLFLCH